MPDFANNPDYPTWGTSEKPLRIAETLKTPNNAYQITSEIVDLYGNHQIRLTGPDGDIFITQELVTLIEEHGDTLFSSSRIISDKMRKKFIGDPKEYGLTRSSRFLNCYLQEGQQLTKAGTPYIAWDGQFGKNGEQPKWNLKLATGGGEGITIATAQWDDREGFRNLIARLGDKEALIVVASVIDAENSKKLAFEMMLDKASGEGKLPQVSPIRVAEIMDESPYNWRSKKAQQTNRTQHSMGSAPRRMGDTLLAEVKIKTSDVWKPVAIAILPPHPQMRPKTKREADLSEEQFKELQNIRQQQRTARWHKRTEKTMTANGYRKVALPQPKPSGSQWPDYAPTIYYTKIKPELWSSIEVTIAEEVKRSVFTPVIYF